MNNFWRNLINFCSCYNSEPENEIIIEEVINRNTISSIRVSERFEQESNNKVIRHQAGIITKSLIHDDDRLIFDGKTDKERDNLRLYNKTPPPLAEANKLRSISDQHKSIENSYLNNANKLKKMGRTDSSVYFFKEAEYNAQKFEQARAEAAVSILIGNHEKIRRDDMVDFHQLFLQEALVALDIFLDSEIERAKSKKKARKVYIVTGWGKHSSNHIAKIKPMVLNRLLERALEFDMENIGCFKVWVNENSILTNQLVKKINSE